MIILSFISMGNYRKDVMKTVIEIGGGNIEVYSGVAAIEKSVKVLQEGDIKFTCINNIFIFDKIIIQLIPLAKFLKCETLLLDLNPRLIHVIPILFIRKLFRKKTVLWGHAYSQSPNSIGEKFRGLSRSLASAILTYTDTQKFELQKIYKNKPIYSAPNALYFESQFFFDPLSIRTNITYVGRMTEKKKPLLLVRAFKESIGKLPPSTKLILVGDGPLAGEIKKLCIDLNILDRCSILGHIDDYPTLNKIYSTSIISVSPGYVGLSITQSFTFGVPMIISKDEVHSPEIEAAQEGFNSIYFDTDNISSLAAKITLAVNDRPNTFDTGVEIMRSCKSKYTVEKMASGILSSVIN
jgi:glycosyltransferase involved in cell wall biosynthesis